MNKILLLILFFICSNVVAAPPQRQNTYVSQTTIRAADVAANENVIFSYLQAGVDTYADGTIVNDDISSSASIGYSKLNLSNSIVNADVNSSAAIAYSKLNLTGAILNADLAGSIADSKLSQITTAGKVSGTALTSLASIPSGAGVIPTANLGSGATATTFLRGDQTYALVPNTSNVIYSWGGIDDAVQDVNIGQGVYKGTSQDPATGTSYENLFLAVGQRIPTNTVLLRSKWVKIAGISTVTVYGRIWTQNGAHAGKLQVDVGTASGSTTSTSTTPAWVTFTIDVSGLSNGTAYDLTIGLSNPTVGGNSEHTYLSSVILLGS